MIVQVILGLCVYYGKTKCCLEMHFFLFADDDGYMSGSYVKLCLIGSGSLFIPMRVFSI